MKMTAILLQGDVDERWEALLSHRCRGSYRLVKNQILLLWIFECSCGFSRAIRNSELLVRRYGRFFGVLDRERSMRSVVELLNVRNFTVGALDSLRGGVAVVFDEVTCCPLSCWKSGSYDRNGRIMCWAGFRVGTRNGCWLTDAYVKGVAVALGERDV